MSEFALKEQYKRFLHSFVVEKHLKKFSEIKILGENFIENCYFLIFEVLEEKQTYFLIIENIEKPIFEKLKAIKNPDNYMVVNKKHFAQIVPIKIREKLAKRGLCSNFEIGMKKNKYFCLHRFVACLYFNCIGFEVHHINKNPCDNHYLNLVPLKPAYHKLVDSDLQNGELFAKDEQQHLLGRSYKSYRTVANNDSLLNEFINLKNQNFSMKEIASKLNRYLKKSKIYELNLFFYYSKGFQKWLETLANIEFSEDYGKFKNVIRNKNMLKMLYR